MRIVAALLLALALLPGHAVAKKEPPLTEEERNVVQVFEAEGYTKDQLFDGAKRWIAENFKSAEAVLDYEDRTAGTLIGNGNMVIDPPMQRGVSYYSVYRGQVGFKMKVESKDGRFRLSFTNVVLQRPPYHNMGVHLPAREEPPTKRRDMDNIRAKLLEFGPQIVASLGKAKGSDDW